MNKTLVFLAAASLLTMSGIAVASHGETDCYNPNGSIDGTKDLDTTEDPFPSDGTLSGFDCDFFLGDEDMVLPVPTFSAANAWGSANVGGQGALDGIADNVYPEAGQGEVFVLLGLTASDDYDIAYYDADGNPQTWANFKEGEDYGNSAGDEIGEVPLGSSYAIVKMWLNSGLGVNGQYDFFEVTKS